MKIKCMVKLNVGGILNSRGLGSSNQARKYLAERVRAHSDPYVPFRQGPLKNTAQISSDGGKLTYVQPYARYQYQGEVMGPNVLTKKGWRSMAKKGGKKLMGRKLKHSGMRGPFWDKRMLADHREDLEKDMAAYVGKRG